MASRTEWQLFRLHRYRNFCLEENYRNWSVLCYLQSSTTSLPTLCCASRRRITFLATPRGHFKSTLPGTISSTSTIRARTSTSVERPVTAALEWSCLLLSLSTNGDEHSTPFSSQSELKFSDLLILWLQTVHSVGIWVLASWKHARIGDVIIVNSSRQTSPREDIHNWAVGM